LRVELRKSKPLYSRSSASAPDADQDTARDHEQRPERQARPHPLVAPEERGKGDRPERLGGDERRDDRDADAERRLEEAEVGDAEQVPGGREPAELTARRQAARPEERHAD